MDCSISRWTRLGAAALAATALACATSEEGSFSGAGSSLSAGNNDSASSTGDDSDSGDASSDSDSGAATTNASTSASNSGSNSDSDSGSTTDDSGTTGDDTTGSTSEDTGTTGVDCDDGLGNLCGNPYDLGDLDEGEMASSQTTTIITPGVADWFQVGFLAVNRPGGGAPSISFAQNDNDAYRFDAYTDMPCGGTPASCGEGGDDQGQATNLVEYTFTDDQPDCCSPPDDSMVSWPGNLYIRVYRVDDGGDCSAYQLQLSR